ncbi:RNA polymerase sigma factor SigF [Kitasatospora misakiensis]|uniref:RNA polymerase sigma factor SigF n=1 Tax=Kitasatospora misakiensis TaxID=67330 RepID=A0ABW0X3C4_9ACTN
MAPTGELLVSAAAPTADPSRATGSAAPATGPATPAAGSGSRAPYGTPATGLRDLLPPELAAVDDPCEVAPADARDLTRTLLRRLAALEEGTREYSYVRTTLVELNLSLVRFAIRRFGAHSEPREDLLQVGAVGLIKAIDRFDPELGVEFTTFAMPTVLGEIRRHFRDTTWAVHVPRRLQELRITLARAQERLAQRLDRAPTVAELAEHLALTPEEVIEGLTAANGHTAGSLDVGGPVDGDAPGPLTDQLGTEDRDLGLVEDLVTLKPLIAALPERERRILSMRFCEDLTQSQIGARLGLSQMHVSRLLARTLRHLREGLEDA